MGVVWRLPEGQALSNLLLVFEVSPLSQGQQQSVHPLPPHSNKSSGIYFLEVQPCPGLAQLQDEIWDCSGFGTASGRWAGRAGRIYPEQTLLCAMNQQRGERRRESL